MYSWSIHFFCFVCLVGRQKREEGRKGGENTRVPARPALARLLILLAVYFLMYRVFFFFLIPFTVFQASLTDFGINLITLLLSIVKSTGEMWNAASRSHGSLCSVFCIYLFSCEQLPLLCLVKWGQTPVSLWCFYALLVSLWTFAVLKKNQSECNAFSFINANVLPDVNWCCLAGGIWESGTETRLFSASFTWNHWKLW